MRASRRHCMALRLLCGLMLAAVMAPAVAVAQVNDFGVGGILDIPSARMNPEDELTVTYSRKDVADIYAIGYQVLPRVEVSFRYTIFNARGISPIPVTPHPIVSRGGKRNTVC